MFSKFMQIPSVESLLKDLLKQLDEELNKSVYIEYYAASFQIKKGSMKVSIERQI